MADGITIDPDIATQIARKVLELEGLERRASVTIAKAGVRGALAVVAKQMRKDLDPRVKLAGKDIKTRVKGGKRLLIVKAKVGFTLNKGRIKTQPPRGKRPGVGFSGNNISWWIRGTDQRQTGSKKSGKKRKSTGNPIANRGRMPAMQPGFASRSLARAQSRIWSEVEKRMAKQLAKEVAKLKR